jgi:RHS repeat-associated protein
LGRVQEFLGTNPTKIGFQDKGNPAGNGNDYTYDANGNLTSDYNKSITSITYNYLNLPQTVTITGKGTITFSYDAAGNKLQKATLDQTVTPNKTTNYYYAGDYVYRSATTGSPDTLEFISQPEGRLRPVRIDTTQAITVANLKYIYDYFLKDHLGSVRSVLTTEQQTDFYAATMETAAATKENALFNNVSTTATGKPPGFSNDNNNQKASRLGDIASAGNKRVGPSIVLKVMAGDTISVGTYGWYTGAVQPPPTTAASLATELIPLLTAGVAGQGGGKGGAIPSAFSDPLLGADITNFLPTRNYISTRPKAYLNWMVVDEEFAAVTSPNHMGAVQIPVCNAGDTMKQIIGPSNMVIRRNGWIYIYLSNESAQEVYFDNLVVNFKHGPLIEQKDYYAFGMEIPGLSTKALKANYKENRSKYNGKEIQEKEFMDTTGLTWEDFGARMYDPQIGRWMIVDPLAEKMRRYSPYAYVFDNPIRFIDPDGKEGVKSSDKDGKNKTIESNVVVLLEQKKEVPKDATEKQKARIEKKNQKIEKRNAATLSDVSKTLNEAYNGDDGKGTKNSNGETIKFKFNIKGVETANTDGGSLGDITKIAREYGLETSEQDAGGNPQIALAAVVTTRSTGGDLGRSNGIYTAVSPNAPGLALAHEIGHTFKLADNYPNSTGGLMDYPPGGLNKSEVDQIWNKAYEK